MSHNERGAGEESIHKKSSASHERLSSSLKGISYFHNGFESKISKKGEKSFMITYHRFYIERPSIG
jgi:hypothetical protein